MPVRGGRAIFRSKGELHSHAVHRYLACKHGASAPTGSTSAHRVAGHCLLLPAASLPTVSAVLAVQRCRFKRPLLLLLFAAALLSAPLGKAQTQPVTGQDGISSSSAATSVTIVVSTGAQLAAAFANNSVQVALISADVALVEDDWAPYAQPFVELNRNFTLLGTLPEQERWVTVDFGYTSAISPGGIGAVRSAKVRLMPGVTLTLRHMVVRNGRELPQFQFMGFDLITDSLPTPEGQAWPVLLADEAGMWQRSCLPSSLNNSVATSIPRHPQFPGAQSATPTLAASPDATGCIKSNSSAVPALKRCWPGNGVYSDLALYAVNADVYMRQARAGYTQRFFRAPYFCDVLMSDECVKTNAGYLGCYYSIYPFSRRITNGTVGSPLPYSTPVSGITREAAGNDSGSSAGNVLGPVLGGVLGGVTLLGGIAAVLFVLVRRRRRDGHADDSAQQGRSQTQYTRQQAGSFKQGASSCAVDAGNASSKSFPGGPQPVGSSHGTRDENTHDSDAAAAEAAMYMLAASELALVPVTPLTPLLPGIPLDVKMGQGGGEVMLLPVVLGKGAYGRVVEGLYGGVRVAVKLLNRGLMADIFGEGVAVGVAAAAPPRRLGEIESCSLQAPVGAGGELCMIAPHQSVAAPGGPQSPQPQTPAAAALAATGVDDVSASDPPQQLLETTQTRAAAAEGSCALEPTAVLSGAPCQGRAELRLEMAPWESVSVAGKVQAPSLRSIMRRTLAQEVEVLARMQHPNIIRLLAANLSTHSPCLVMERMDTSLDRLVHGGRSMAAGAEPLPLNKVLHIALHVAHALAYLHPTIIHRDLKPGNVLISDADSPTPIVKLADFGLSRLQDTVLVTARVDVGTAPYMAPETLNIQNFTITHHSDMYSYGIMLWEMLASEKPWQGLNMVQIAYVILESGQRPLFDTIGEDRCPRTLRALIHQCWDPVPERRPGASEVVKMIMLIMEKARASGSNQALGKFQWPAA